ncbi:tRNA (adenine(22)-N(1))-methyltransferase TrmK [Gottschalkia purinilytica]|uniref:tRNA (Adenine(22)-N(1))-methyltransferase TrmK n=1 Tax=Gottschalkia purinilytica TaxID=1503 RepID=A0A0L0WD31_GOTPU|nr:class I SAM-dependent methyltransferase [Gottschalkia purinilytica]KNF09330.1 tRNA (adenine(22)-N(1))-methyltransferase TrmK [Gottschalkia purinilytica]
MKLSPRLKAIASYVKKGDIVADIGTDHGYIPVYLVNNNISEKIIASDINEGPLNNAIEYIKKNKLQNEIDTRLGDGLNSINPNEVDTVIIAGMGGLLIAEILEESKEVTKSIKNFILQPMVAVDELRRYLYDNEFKIIDEKLAKEGDKLYHILYVQHGKDELEKEIYFEVGKKLIENKDELLEEFLKLKINKIEKILNNLQNQHKEKSRNKYIELKEKYSQYMEVLKSLC